MLEISGLVAGYQGFTLGPLDFHLGTGEVLTLVGTNGSGKSTLIRTMLGLHRAKSGDVLFDGRSLVDRRPQDLCLVGYVTDSVKNLIGGFSAREYWRYCLIAHERALGQRSPQVLDRAEQFARLLDFPLEQARPLRELSLGTARKAQIVAAAMIDPILLILDEPFIGLDFLAARALESLLVEFRESGTSIVVSGHDLGLASRIADRVLVLHGGTAVLNSSIEDVGGHSLLEGAVERSLHDARRGHT